MKMKKETEDFFDILKNSCCENTTSMYFSEYDEDDPILSKYVVLVLIYDSICPKGPRRIFSDLITITELIYFKKIKIEKICKNRVRFSINISD